MMRKMITFHIKMGEVMEETEQQRSHSGQDDGMNGNNVMQ